MVGTAVPRSKYTTNKARVPLMIVKYTKKNEEGVGVGTGGGAGISYCVRRINGGRGRSLTS